MLLQRYRMLALVPTILVLGGTLGYYLLEPSYNLLDALYMTVITLTTVGYGEVHPLSEGGRIFTIVLLLGGVFTLFYTSTEMLRAVISGEVRDLLGRQRMARSLAQMKQHIIVCGYGRMGRHVCLQFQNERLPFVIIDLRSEVLIDFSLSYGVAVNGDATSDAILKEAGIERARALIAVAPSDADNLFITMSARLLNDKLFIVARAEGEMAEQKLLRAGANRVVAPYALGGSKVANAVLRPTVVDFLELATRTEHLEMQIEETRIRPGSKLEGKTLHDSRLRQDLGIIVVAIKKAEGKLIANPPGNAVMEGGDTLIALGNRQHLDRLDELAGA